jgi:hypothetical protein
METPIIRCVKCGAGTDEHRIGVQVDSGLIHCASCDEEYTPAEVREILAGWEPLLKWAESHPAHRATLKVAKG